MSSAGLKGKTRRPKIGETFIRVWGGPSVHVVGTPISEEEQERRLLVYCEVIQPHEDDSAFYASRPNLFLCRCYSPDAPDGELGNLTIESVHFPITKREFEEARKAGWPQDLPHRYVS